MIIKLNKTLFNCFKHSLAQHSNKLPTLCLLHTHACAHIHIYIIKDISKLAWMDVNMEIPMKIFISVLHPCIHR